MSAASQFDAGLVARLRARDPDALASAVGDHARALYRAARGMGFQEAEADDLIQDVFTTFLELLDRFEGRSQVRTWLCPASTLGVTGCGRRRICIARWNPKRSERPWPAAWRACTAAQREAFVLREIEGLDTAEICKILGVTVTNMDALPQSVARAVHS